MNDKRILYNILDECLERVLGGESIDDCLEWYPDYAEKLRPLLLTALDAQKALDVKPRREFRDRAGYEFQKAIREMQPAARSRGFSSVLKPAWATVIIVVVVLLAGTGTVFAANNSLPGEPLYAVKTATESVRLAFAFSEEARADLYVKLADRRVDEIVKMAKEGDAVQVGNATDKLEEHLLAMSELDIVGGADMLARQLTAVESFEAAMPAMTPAPTSPQEPSVLGGESDATAEETVPPTISIPKAAGAPEDGELKSAPDDTLAADSEQSELEVLVANSAAMNARSLRSLLDEVDEEVREALYRAIEVVNVGYSIIINNLD